MNVTSEHRADVHEHEEKEKYLMKFRYKNIKKAKKFVKSHIPSHALQTMEEEITIKRSFKDFDILALLHEIKVKTLVISGKYDGKILYSEGQKISELLPNSEFVLFEQSGELPFVEEKEKFISEMNEFKLFEEVIQFNITMCGYGPVMTAISLSKMSGKKDCEILGYRTSGDVTGDYSSVVGYASGIFK